jgi:tetratricopeptide (TPR) repeat protein
MESHDVQKLLQEGIEAAKAAHRKDPSAGTSLTQKRQREQARQLLFQVTVLDEANIQAWLWLSSVVDGTADKIACLENVLLLNPEHATARAALARLQPTKTTSFIRKVAPKPQPPRVKAPDYSRTFSTPPQGTAWSAQAIDTIEASLLQVEARPEKTPLEEGCPFCQQPITHTDIACPHCTLPLIMDCPACNTSMDVEWETCKECGQPMGDYRFGSVYFTLLATGYQRYNRLNKAVDSLLVAQKMNPRQPDLHRYLGELQAELGKINEAVITLQKAIEQEPDQAGPYLALGRVLQKEGRWEEAEKVYRTGMKAIPQSSEPLFAMGDLMMQRGELRKARSYFKKATRLDPNHGLAWAGLGRLHERAGDRSSAVRAYQHALKTLAPEVPEVPHIQERLEVLARPGGSGGLFDLLRKIVG